MAHTCACNLLHCVFSTKDRANLIRDRERLWQYIGGIARAKNIPLLGIGGTSNHVHALIALPPVLPLAKVIQDLKGNSSKWLGETGQRFAWQRGYGAFSGSESGREAVLAYIARQEEHHRKWSFEDEFLSLLRRYRVSFDPQTVFGRVLSSAEADPQS